MPSNKAKSVKKVTKPTTAMASPKKATNTGNVAPEGAICVKNRNELVKQSKATTPNIAAAKTAKDLQDLKIPVILHRSKSNPSKLILSLPINNNVIINSIATCSEGDAFNLAIGELLAVARLKDILDHTGGKNYEAAAIKEADVLAEKAKIDAKAAEELANKQAKQRAQLIEKTKQELHDMHRRDLSHIVAAKRNEYQILITDVLYTVKSLRDKDGMLSPAKFYHYLQMDELNIPNSAHYTVEVQRALQRLAWVIWLNGVNRSKAIQLLTLITSNKSEAEQDAFIAAIIKRAI